jgi:hypothetical protein
MPEMVGMLAAHLSSDDQLHDLAICLASICQQSRLPHRIVLSFSAANAQLADDAAAAIEAARNKISDLVVLRQTSPRSQFQHYAACCGHVKEALGESRREALWCLFSDDDDIWHPDRCQLYESSIQQAARFHAAQFAHVHSLLCATFATER